MPLKAWRHGHRGLVDAETVGVPVDPDARNFRTGELQAIELRGELSRTREELESAGHSAADMARVRAVLNLPDSADLGDVLHAIGKLKRR